MVPLPLKIAVLMSSPPPGRTSSADRAVRRQVRRSAVPGPRELVGQTARLLRQALHAGVVARGAGLPVADLEIDIPLPQHDLLGLQREPFPLPGQQLDLPARGG